ncbi:protein of unknown function [Serratia sp. Tan611]|nr:protein of unknown function [Serratia sp. Tan611]
MKQTGLSPGLFFSGLSSVGRARITELSQHSAYGAEDSGYSHSLRFPSKHRHRSVVKSFMR